jgi:hypothetical protein
MTGKGKYDDICTSVRRTTDADGVIVLVFGGIHGHGFSAQLPPGLVVPVPAMLRSMADQIEADQREGVDL